MKKYVVWILLAGLLFGQTNSYGIPKKQKELTKTKHKLQYPSSCLIFPPLSLVFLGPCDHLMHVRSE